MDGIFGVPPLNGSYCLRICAFIPLDRYFIFLSASRTPLLHKHQSVGRTASTYSCMAVKTTYPGHVFYVHSFDSFGVYKPQGIFMYIIRTWKN